MRGCMTDPFSQMVSTINKKPDEGALHVVITFRGSEKMRLFVNAKGGPAYLRQLVAEQMEKQEADE